MKKRNKILGSLAPITSVFRIVAPLFVFSFPLQTTLANVFLDFIDGTLYAHRGFTKDRYDRIDKTLDLYWYTVSLIYALGTLPFKIFISFLYIIRLIGQLLFLRTRNHKYFIIFPDFYQVLFIFLIVLKYYPSLGYLGENGNLLTSLGVLFVLQFLREVYLHKLEDYIRPLFPDFFRWPERMYTR